LTPSWGIYWRIESSYTSTPCSLTFFQLTKFDVRSFDCGEHSAGIRTKDGERGDELERAAGELAEEFHGFLVAARLLEHFAVLRYDSVAEGGGNLASFALAELFRERDGVGTPTDFSSIVLGCTP
jgi:hypothetical protein